jgi:hypothetical protein
MKTKTQYLLSLATVAFLGLSEAHIELDISLESKADGAGNNTETLFSSVDDGSFL